MSRASVTHLNYTKAL